MKRNPVFPSHLHLAVKYIFFFFNFIFINNAIGQYAQGFSGPVGSDFFVEGFEEITQVNPNKDPSYNIFWIFSDGHYELIEDAKGPASRTVIYNDFVSTNKDTVAVYFTEKYVNGDPPDFADPNGTKTIMINNGANSQSQLAPHPSFHSPIVYKNKIAIDYNHLPRAGYESVFVVAYAPPDTASGHLHFFYHAQQIRDNSGKIIPANGVFEYQEVFPNSLVYKRGTYFPFYHSPRQVVNESVADFDLSHFNTNNQKTSFNSEFGSVLTTSYIANEIHPWPNYADIDERRLFHVLNTIDDQVDSLYNFMILLTSDNANHATELINEYGVEKAERIAKLLDISPVPTSNFIGKINNEYIIEVLDTTLELTGEHDPNNLCLTDICTNCPDAPDPLSSCQARLFVEVCNDGSTPASNISITFYDKLKNHLPPNVHNGFKNLKFEEIVELWKGGTTRQLDKCFDNLDGAVLRTNIEAPNFLLPAVYDKPIGKYIEPACARIYFTVTATDEACRALMDTDCCPPFSDQNKFCSTEVPSQCWCSIEAQIKLGPLATVYPVCNKICKEIKVTGRMDKQCTACNICPEQCSNFFECYFDNWPTYGPLKK